MRPQHRHSCPQPSRSTLWRTACSSGTPSVAVVEVRWFSVFMHMYKFNVEVLRRANMSNIEATLTASQLRWTGHIIRMNDSRLPKAVFYGELAKGKCLRGGQRLRYKDVVKRHLKATHITVDHWETLAQDRQQWRQAIHKGKSHIEENISQKYQHDHNLRHGFPDASALIIFCVNCGRGFKSQIGLFSHQRAKHVTEETLH